MALGALAMAGSLEPALAAPAEASSIPVGLAEVEPAPAPPVEVIFTGFARRRDKSAAIFVRMTGEVPVAVERAGRRVVYRLSGAKLGVANNSNPLPTGHFGSPVASVSIVPSEGSVSVVIELTDDPGEKLSTHRIVSQARLATLIIELPASE